MKKIKKIKLVPFQFPQQNYYIAISVVVTSYTVTVYKYVQCMYGINAVIYLYIGNIALTRKIIMYSDMLKKD